MSCRLGYLRQGPWHASQFHPVPYPSWSICRCAVWIHWIASHCNHGLQLFGITFPQTHHVHKISLDSSFFPTTIIPAYVSLCISYPQNYTRGLFLLYACWVFSFLVLSIPSLGDRFPTGWPTIQGKFSWVNQFIWWAWLTHSTSPLKNMSGQSTFNGVNLPIGPLAGTINHGLFVWSGGSVLLGQGHQYLCLYLVAWA